MSTYSNLLVVITENCEARPAFERALVLAGHVGARLTLIDIVEPIPEETQALIDVGILQALERTSGEQRAASLAAFAVEAKRAGVAVATKLASGSAFRVAIRTVLQDGYDLVVKTIDRRDERSRSTHGGTDKHLLRKCPCHLWLVAEREPPEGTSVLAAVNPDPSDPEDSALAAQILAAATTIAVLDGAPLDVLHAWKVFGEWLLRGPEPLVSDPEVDHIVGQGLNRHDGFLDALIENTPTPGIVPSKHLVHARPADAIIDFVASHPIRLLVMGTVGRTGVPGLLIGNTAERVLSEVTCSIFALKPRGFVSPVTLES